MKCYLFGCRLINYMRYLTYTYLAIDMKYFALLFAAPTVAIILFLKGIAAVITIAFIAVAVAGFSEWVQGQRVSILINIYRQ